jgi:hypothetical protein
MNLHFRRKKVDGTGDSPPSMACAHIAFGRRWAPRKYFRPPLLPEQKDFFCSYFILSTLPSSSTSSSKIIIITIITIIPFLFREKDGMQGERSSQAFFFKLHNKYFYSMCCNRISQIYSSQTRARFLPFLK